MTARVAEALASSLRGNGRFALQYRIRTASGQLRHVRESGVASPDGDGMVLEGFVMDVTSQQRTIRALAQAEMRYRTIFEHAEGIFQSSKTGRYLAANPALARLYGYASPEELILNLSDISCQLYVEAGRREEFLRLMETAGEVVNFESEVYRKDGQRIWISKTRMWCHRNTAVSCITRARCRTFPNASITSSNWKCRPILMRSPACPTAPCCTTG
jgi:PAS domain S-box-containing protein